MDDLVTSKSRFIEADGNIRVQVFSLLAVGIAAESIKPAGGAISKTAESVKSTGRAVEATGAAACTAEASVSENIFQDIVHVAAFKVEFLIAAVRASVSAAPAGTETAESTACCAVGTHTAVQPGMTELIVDFSLLLIAEHFVGFCRFFELLPASLLPALVSGWYFSPVFDMLSSKPRHRQFCQRPALRNNLVYFP